MLNAILGVKKGTTEMYVEGRRMPVTVVEAGPCRVVGFKTKSRDGYSAVVIGFGQKPVSELTKPLLGHLRAAGVIPDKQDDVVVPFYFREVRVSDENLQLKPGEVIDVSSVFQKGDVVDVSGITKGKGFAGVVKRWGFAGGPKTHGQSDRHRAPGSIGQGTTPGRVHKGKKMAGRMGGVRRTVKNLKIADVQNNLVYVLGLVPGRRGSILMLRKHES